MQKTLTKKKEPKTIIKAMPKEIRIKSCRKVHKAINLKIFYMKCNLHLLFSS